MPRPRHETVEWARCRSCKDGTWEYVGYKFKPGDLVRLRENTELDTWHEALKAGKNLRDMRAGTHDDFFKTVWAGDILLVVEIDDNSYIVGLPAHVCYRAIAGETKIWIDDILFEKLL